MFSALFIVGAMAIVGGLIGVFLTNRLQKDCLSYRPGDKNVKRELDKIRNRIRMFCASALVATFFTMMLLYLTIGGDLGDILLQLTSLAAGVVVLAVGVVITGVPAFEIIDRNREISNR